MEKEYQTIDFPGGITIIVCPNCGAWWKIDTVLSDSLEMSYCPICTPGQTRNYKKEGAE